MLNPAVQTPVVVNTLNNHVLIDSGAICEYFEETVEKSPLLGGSSMERAETRRLVAWFDQKLYNEVTLPMLTERRRSEEHTSELQSLMRISYAVFCLKKKNKRTITHKQNQ